jgi:hypothetical protein
MSGTRAGRFLVSMSLAAALVFIVEGPLARVPADASSAPTSVTRLPPCRIASRHAAAEAMGQRPLAGQSESVAFWNVCVFPPSNPRRIPAWAFLVTSKQLVDSFHSRGGVDGVLNAHLNSRLNQPIRHVRSMGTRAYWLQGSSTLMVLRGDLLSVFEFPGTKVSGTEPEQVTAARLVLARLHRFCSHHPKPC